MCGGCNVLAESAGASLIVARYWWVARQGRKAVAEAEAITAGAARSLEVPAGLDFDDPMDDLTRIT